MEERVNQRWRVGARRSVFCLHGKHTATRIVSSRLILHPPPPSSGLAMPLSLPRLNFVLLEHISRNPLRKRKGHKNEIRMLTLSLL